MDKGGQRGRSYLAMTKRLLPRMYRGVAALLPSPAFVTPNAFGSHARLLLIPPRLTNARICLNRNSILQRSVPVHHRVPNALHDLGEPLSSSNYMLLKHKQYHLIMNQPNHL